ncbi:MAG: DUF1848 domain-containing protein [Candidatus Methanoplasma sp.]|jgi:hypothetical protein|nr:DUF1848 domain-containing protein [Candidatus Methanoplasma sp.]
MMICASRRTDIPAFHSEWFMNRLRAGYVLVRNPVHRSTVYRVDLTPRNVDCIVFITKDPRPIIPFLDEIDRMGLNYLFQITITPYGKDVEPGVGSKADIADSFRRLSERIGKEHIQWRYDPVLFNDRFDIGYHRRKFETLCRELQGYTERCTFSFLDMYDKLERSPDSSMLRSATEEEMNAFGQMISEISERYGIVPSYCCARYDLSSYGIRPKGCIDREMLMSLGIPFEKISSPIRKGCECVKNIDIGGYDTCGHDCIYCYANRNTKESRKKKIYSPGSEMLHGTVGPDDEITELSSRTALRLSDF